MKISLSNTFIKDHLSSFKKSDGHFLIADVLIFFVLPIILTIIVNYILKDIPKQFIESLLTMFSILTPLLFALLPMAFNLVTNDSVTAGFKLINEFKANVLFTILLSLIFILMLSTWFLTDNWKFLLNILIYWLFFEVIIHLIFLLQRFNILFNEYINLLNITDI